MLKLITGIRNEYFPHRLAVGRCVGVCILIDAILKYELHHSVYLVYGKLDNCYHTWLSVDGIHIDPPTDCTIVKDARSFVTFTNTKEYRVNSIETFDLRDFFKEMTVYQLKKYWSL